MALKVNIKKNLDGFKLDINFAIDNGLTVLFGQSGAGKSTTLKIIIGLLTADEGEIILDEKKLFCSSTKINLSPQNRFISYIFQNHALFPHLTVFENIFYGAKRYEKQHRQMLAKEVIEKFKIEDISHKYPYQISGGQQQKVAFARTIISKPRALLLDEPFSALDTATRTEMRANLKIIQKELGIPTIVVTHDMYEACSLADTMLVIANGQITQKESLPQACHEITTLLQS